MDEVFMGIVAGGFISLLGFVARGDERFGDADL